MKGIVSDRLLIRSLDTKPSKGYKTTLVGAEK